MSKYPLPENELERIHKLKAYELLRSGKDPNLDIFVKAAQLIGNCPVAFVTIIGEDTQYIKSCVGVELDDIKREDTICQFTILSKEVLIIPDTFLDERTSANPLVRAANVRCYAGIPLLVEEGNALGTICIADFKPRVLEQAQIDDLKQLGEGVTQMLLSYKRKGQAEYFSEVFKITKSVICILDKQHRIKEVNLTLLNTFNVSKSKVIGKPFHEFIGEIEGFDYYEQLLQKQPSGLQFTKETAVEKHKPVKQLFIYFTVKVGMSLRPCATPARQKILKVWSVLQFYLWTSLSLKKSLTLLMLPLVWEMWTLF